MKKNYKVILLIVVLGVPLFLQAQSVESLLERYFNDVRAGKNPAALQQFKQPENARRMLPLLSSYATDTAGIVRLKAYGILHEIATQSKQQPVRQQAVSQLLVGCRDHDSGAAGVALGYVSGFRKEDFTAAAKDSIRRLFIQKIAHFDNLLRLIGFLNLSDLAEAIRPYTQPGNTQAIRWAAIVSLARMKDGAASDDMMRRVKKLPVNDDIVYKLFPDLAYSRAVEAIRYMIEQMKSDEKNCMSADAEKEQPIPCGYRIMEILAPVIEGYPLTLDSSGDIKTKDYVLALKTVREWFVSHPDFKIRDDNY